MILRIARHIKNTLLGLTVATSLAVSQVPVPVFAAPVDVLTQCNNQSQVCKGTNKNSLYAILKNVINLLLTISGAVAVIMIVIGGIRYTTSNGDQSQVTSAKNTILYAIVGLVVAIMAFAIVNWVLSQI
jgi:hypothetical protein